MTPAGRTYIHHGSRTDEFRIWNVSDIHLGSASCAKEQLKRDLKIIEDDPFSFWYAGGDLADYISPNDKRWNANEIDEELLSAGKLGNIGITMYEHLRDLFSPIKHKCLGLGQGNHETKYMSMNNQQGLHGWLCTELGVPNIRYSAIMDLVFCRTTGAKVPHIAKKSGKRSEAFRVAIHHGFGGAATPAGKLNALLRWMRIVDADIFFFGHVHDQKAQRLQRLGANRDCTKQVNKDKVGVISGGYLKTYAENQTSYGEMKGYEPTTLGASYVTIRPNDREVWARV
jgi:hypothetical protein